MRMVGEGMNNWGTSSGDLAGTVGEVMTKCSLRAVCEKYDEFEKSVCLAFIDLECLI